MKKQQSKRGTSEHEEESETNDGCVDLEDNIFHHVCNIQFCAIVNTINACNDEFNRVITRNHIS